MSYTVKKINDKFIIHESQSDHMIHVNYKDEKDVYATARKMNLGSGFNGWTPYFVAHGFQKE